ncbi:MAG: amino acid adenylation domain-containing protein, partial [Cyanobacteria bacterium J06649_4]
MSNPIPGESMELLLLYDTSRFSANAIARLTAHLELLLTAFVEQPSTTLAEIPRLSDVDRQQLNEWNSVDWQASRETVLSQQLASAQVAKTPAREYSAYCIHQLIEQQAKRTPDKIAVVFGELSITYAELNQRANQLAYELRSRGVAAGSYIAVCLHRSVELIVSILAVLKSGAAYVPLDPTYPSARIEYCLQDTTPQLIITQRSVVLESLSIPRLDIDVDSKVSVHPKTNLENTTKPEDLAYIIYTSGSTGQPKGVVVSHRNLVHSTTARFEVYDKSVERFLLLSSIAFDSSIAGLFWTLCQGGALVVAPRRIEQDMQQLATLIAQQQITHTLCVPTLYSLLLQSVEMNWLATLKVVIVAGEACSRNLAQRHHAQLSGAALYNEYGPSEASVWCTAYRVPRDLPLGPVAIGRSIPNTQIYLLDEQKQPVPLGAVGEIYVAGAGVTSGYLNREGKTAEVFGEISVTSLPTYRTGDLGRFREDGCLEWLGRCDRQVKIRGYRIELGEIEDALREAADIQEAVVVVKPMTSRLAHHKTAAQIPLSEISLDDVDSLIAALAALPSAQSEMLLSTVEEGS